MERTELRIPASVFDSLRSELLRDAPVESAAFLLAGRSRRGGVERILARRSISVPPSTYRIKEELHLDIAPQTINALAGLCEANKLGTVICHSHPSFYGAPSYSPADDRGERRIAGFLWENLGADVPVASLLFSADSVTGRVWVQPGRYVPLDEIVIVGRSVTRIVCGRDSLQATVFDAEMASRQVQAFGADGQARISASKVAIVGLGGTGSPVAEQLLRLGVNDFVVIDPDRLTKSSISRGYGSFERQLTEDSDAAGKRLGLPKAESLASHLRSIRKGVNVLSIYGNVLLPRAAEALLDRDFIFSCTDEHWGRSLLNQIAYQYLIPAINMGMRIDAQDGRIRAGNAVLHVLRPGLPCLWCYEYLKSDVIRAESLLPEERERLARERYVMGVGGDAPSVVSLTSMIGSLAVTQFLQMLTDFRGELGDIACLRHDLMTGEIRRGIVQQLDPCICSRYLSRGDLAPLPTCANEKLLDELARARL